MTCFVEQKLLLLNGQPSRLATFEFCLNERFSALAPFCIYFLNRNLLVATLKMISSWKFVWVFFFFLSLSPLSLHQKSIFFFSPSVYHFEIFLFKIPIFDTWNSFYSTKQEIYLQTQPTRGFIFHSYTFQQQWTFEFQMDKSTWINAHLSRKWEHLMIFIFATWQIHFPKNFGQIFTEFGLGIRPHFCT